MHISVREVYFGTQKLYALSIVLLLFAVLFRFVFFLSCLLFCFRCKDLCFLNHSVEVIVIVSRKWQIITEWFDWADALPKNKNKKREPDGMGNLYDDNDKTNKTIENGSLSKSATENTEEEKNEAKKLHIEEICDLIIFFCCCLLAFVEWDRHYLRMPFVLNQSGKRPCKNRSKLR